MSHAATTRRLALLLGFALTAATVPAAAQGGAAEPRGHTYTISQGPAEVGETTLAFVKTDAAGFAGEARSTVTIPGLLDLSSTLTVADDGSALEYLLTGTVRGIDIVLDADFHDGGVTLRVTQAGRLQTLELPAAPPLYVIDNNLLDGLLVLARQALRRPGTRLDVSLLVPQVALLGTATALAEPGSEELTHGEGTTQVTRVAVGMAVAGQTVDSVVWLDAAGDIVRLDQPASGVRFERLPAEPAAAVEASPDAVAEYLAATAACVAVREVSVESTGATLAGLLSVPTDGIGPHPAVLVWPGSGPVDLAGNALPVIRNSSLEQLAYALGCRGYAVLRIAKLGIPPSTGDGNAVTLDTYARNAADWLALLTARPDIDPARIALLGHSEGGMVALYATAAGAVTPAAIVLVATPGRPFDALLEEQLLARAAEGGASPAELEALRAQIVEAVAALRASTGTRLELVGALADNAIARSFAHAAGLMRSLFAHDPADLIAGLDTPLLIVQGEKDMQVRSVDAELLAAAAPSARLVLLPDMTHMLVDEAGPALDGLVPNADDTISGALVSAVGDFLAERMAAGAPR